MKQVNGFTLVELLTTLALAGVLVTVAIPAMSNWYHKSAITDLQYTLLHSINYARVQGIGRQSTVTLCPGDNQCSPQWSGNILIFLDDNRNGNLDPEDRLLKKIHLQNTGGDLDWRSFRRTDYLQFTSEGLTAALNGTLHYCHSKVPDYNFAIVLARTGRTRVHHEPNCS